MTSVGATAAGLELLAETKSIGPVMLSPINVKLGGVPVDAPHVDSVDAKTSYTLRETGRAISAP